VATGFGAVLAMWPVLTVPALAAFAVWAITLGLTRFMSLASITGAIVLPSTVVAMALGGEGGSLTASLPFLVVTGAIAAFVVFRHRKNLGRIRAGAEPRVGRKKTAEG
jgi:acyl phosphate:glycerol-3-phosphate acyltransferase